MNRNMSRLRFGIAGAGFWTPFQLNGWLEVAGLECVAIANRTRSRAEALAARFSIPHVFDSPEEMLAAGGLDFLDIVTSVDTHPGLVALAARHGVPVVCQKPMAPSLEQAEAMVQSCAQAAVPLLINENWRWQAPIRELKRILDAGTIGSPFRARISFITGFPVFDNQPFLRQLPEFILTDLGSHLLDVARFLFGEVANLFCHTQRVHPEIAGEDAATILLRSERGASVLVEMAYAENYIEDDAFPQTRIFIEGSNGSLELLHGFRIHVTTSSGTEKLHVPPPRFAWADPRYEIVHSSIVPCQRNLADALRGESPAETTGEDNLRTVRLVFAAYESARTGGAVAVELP
jgi:predicted dehydrogenase